MKKLFMLCALATCLVNATEKPSAKVLEHIHQKLDKISRRTFVYKYGIVPCAIYGAYTAVNNAYNNQDVIKSYLKAIQNHQEPQTTLQAAAARLQKMYQDMKPKIEEKISDLQKNPNIVTTLEVTKPAEKTEEEKKND